MTERSRRQFLTELSAVGSTAATASLAGCSAIAEYAIKGENCVGQANLYNVGNDYNAEIDGVKFERASRNQLGIKYEDREKETESLEEGDQINIEKYLEGSPKMDLKVEHIDDERIGLSSEQSHDYCMLKK